MEALSKGAEAPLHRILVVDDDQLVGKTLTSFFKTKSHDVVTCLSGQEALARDDLASFDLLITDLQLPEIDGIDLITAVLQRQPEMATLLMTGHASIDSAVRALRHGAVDYIQKPFTLVAFDAAVERALKMQRLRRANTELQRQLKARNAELEAVNQELDAFAARLAHDLRSPINSVRGLVGFVREDIADTLDEETRDLLDRAIRSGDQALRMVSDLLDFARLGHGQLPLRPVALKALVAHCIDTLIEHAPRERCSITVEPLPVVLGHEGLLSQVFLNLIDNAIKYSEPKPEIRIRIHAQPRGDRLVDICVEDNGVGFDPEHARLLFLPFQRLHRRSEFTGAGMGLANVKRILERHGGSIAASSRPGEGSTFQVSLQRS